MTLLDPQPSVRRGEPPPPSDLGFRKSLLWRLPPEAVQGLPEPMARLAPAGARGLEFAELVFEEIAAVETRINPVWFLRVEGPAAERPQLIVDTDAFSLGAEVGMPRTETRPRVLVNIGAALALDDLALFALSEDLLLAPTRGALAPLVADPVGSAMRIGAVGDRRDASRRFVRYDDALNDDRFDRAALTFVAPTAPWRLLQASLLSELMLAFVLLHERAHFALGHLDLLVEDGAEDLGLKEVDDIALQSNEEGNIPTSALPVGTRRVMEFQADTQAYFLLCAYALSKDGPCRRYERMLADWSIEPPAGDLREVSFGAGVRLCLTAATLTCLAFHLASPPWRAADPTHPTPHARLMNMMINTPIVSPIVQLGDDGAFILERADTEDANGGASPDFETLVSEVFGMALVDLQLVAGELGQTLAPLSPGADGAFDPAAWVNDLGAFWISDDESLNTQPVTDAGLEILRLKPVEAAIDPRLQALQIERFGQVMSIDLGRLMDDGASPPPSIIPSA